MATDSNMNTVISELVQGQNYATQLKHLLQKPHDPNSSVSANQLAHSILSTFTCCLSLLTSSSPELSQDLPTSQADSADDLKSEHFGEVTKRHIISRDRRGCYKRKKNSHSWTVVSSSTNDEYAWRKYGQKDILNAKYPRNYFRCTRKYEQDCKAVKQVQKMENDPEKYHITYIGHHTCRDLSSSPQILGDSCDPSWGSCQLNQHVSTVPIKQEESSTPSDLTDNVSNTLNCTMWKEFMAANDDYGAAVFSSTEATSQNLDMDFAVKSLDFFDKDFHFDETEFFQIN